MAKSSITQKVPFRNKEIEKMSVVEVPYYTAEDVQKLLGIGSSKAYYIIKQLNDELNPRLDRQEPQKRACKAPERIFPVYLPLHHGYG